MSWILQGESTQESQFQWQERMATLIVFPIHPWDLEPIEERVRVRQGDQAQIGLISERLHGRTWLGSVASTTQVIQ